MAMPRPEKPLPTIATSTSLGRGSAAAVISSPDSTVSYGDVSFGTVTYLASMALSVAKPARMTAPQRREQLLDVTKEIVAEHGFHAVSIEAVAREAGISRPIVYGHFGD